ncbi:MAG: hypothetical protein E7191_06675 [Erysipelotrichaceae bacterium]|nr:hypothetical protein [Erysipelotrichaceae bacterium]
MITVFNRKELLITYDMRISSEVRTILHTNHIEYKVKVVNTLCPSIFGSRNRRHKGSYGVDLSKTYEYKIYVKSTDYENALYLINSIS